MSNLRFFRSGSFLIELVLSAISAALCGAVCLGLFVKADSLSRESLDTSQALYLVQNAAELLKTEAGARAARPGAETAYYDAAWVPASEARPGGAALVTEISVEDDMLTAKLRMERDTKIFCELEVKRFLPAGEVGG